MAGGSGGGRTIGRSRGIVRLTARAAGWALAACLWIAPAHAQQDGAPAAQPATGSAQGGGEIVVATRVVPPFVIEEAPGRLSGFSVDLWRAIAAEAGLKSTFQVYKTLPELLGAVQGDGNPVGISAVSITAAREKYLEFSQPMFRSGLQIMAPVRESSLADLLRAAFSPLLAKSIGVVLLALLIPAHVAWLIHRFSPTSKWNVSRSYWPGILEAFYWSAEKLVSVAEGKPEGSAGRLFNFLLTFVIVMAFASLTGLIASALTLSSIRADISGPSDLIGKRVATVHGSTAEAFLKEIGASVASYPNFTDAVAALAAGGPGSEAVKPVALVYDERRVSVPGRELWHRLPAQFGAAPRGQHGAAEARRKRNLPADLRKMVRQGQDSVA